VTIDGMFNEQWIGRIGKKRLWHNLRHLPGRSEEDQENPKPRLSVSGPKIKARTPDYEAGNIY
jgi:hypothetical protein